jgi:hypothetical protein
MARRPPPALLALEDARRAEGRDGWVGGANLRALRLVLLHGQDRPGLVRGHEDDADVAAHVVALGIVDPIRRRQHPVAADHDGREEPAKSGAAPVLPLEDLPHLRAPPEVPTLLALNFLIREALHGGGDHLFYAAVGSAQSSTNKLLKTTRPL